jgi:hypothetical protein
VTRARAHPLTFHVFVYYIVEDPFTAWGHGYVRLSDDVPIEQTIMMGSGVAGSTCLQFCPIFVVHPHIDIIVPSDEITVSNVPKERARRINRVPAVGPRPKTGWPPTSLVVLAAAFDINNSWPGP